jgi:hypothetical protein
MSRKELPIWKKLNINYQQSELVTILRVKYVTFYTLHVNNEEEVHRGTFVTNYDTREQFATVFIDPSCLRRILLDIIFLEKCLSLF